MTYLLRTVRNFRAQYYKRSPIRSSATNPFLHIFENDFLTLKKKKIKTKLKGKLKFELNTICLTYSFIESIKFILIIHDF
jgi:hypothetical protein